MALYGIWKSVRTPVLEYSRYMLSGHSGTGIFSICSAFLSIRLALSSSASFSHAARSVTRAPGAAGFAGSHSAISAILRFDCCRSGGLPPFPGFFATAAAHAVAAIAAAMARRRAQNVKRVLTASH